MSGKKVKQLRTQKEFQIEIEIRDKLIGALLHEVAEHKIKIPSHITSIIEILYASKE